MEDIESESSGERGRSALEEVGVEVRSALLAVIQRWYPIFVLEAHARSVLPRVAAVAFSHPVRLLSSINACRRNEATSGEDRNAKHTCFLTDTSCYPLFFLFLLFSIHAGG